MTGMDGMTFSLLGVLRNCRGAGQALGMSGEYTIQAIEVQLVVANGVSNAMSTYS